MNLIKDGDESPSTDFRVVYIDLRLRICVIVTFRHPSLPLSPLIAPSFIPNRTLSHITFYSNLLAIFSTRIRIMGVQCVQSQFFIVCGVKKHRRWLKIMEVIQDFISSAPKVTLGQI